MPLLLTFHGSRRRGHSLVEKWKGLAEDEKIIVAGLDSVNPVGWAMPQDGPEPVYDLVEHLEDAYPVIDPRRVYLFGHSAGAYHALLLAMMEPGYFAAAALSGGALPQGEGQIAIDPRERKPPLILFVGTEDALMDAVRHSQKILQERGFPVEVRELVDHGHNYYRISKLINGEAWGFLKSHRLEFPPYYTEYNFR